MGNYIKNDTTATKIIITLVEGFKIHYGIPSTFLLDIATQKITIEQFSKNHLTRLGFNKTQINKIIATLTGYSPGTVSNWRCKATPTTPASVERILGIIDVIITLFTEFKVTITRRH